MAKSESPASPQYSKEDAQSLYNEGFTGEEIAAHFGVPPSRVFKNLETKRQRGPGRVYEKPSRVELTEGLKRVGGNVKRYAEQNGMSRQVVRDWVSDYQIKKSETKPPKVDKPKRTSFLSGIFRKPKSQGEQPAIIAEQEPSVANEQPVSGPGDAQWLKEYPRGSVPHSRPPASLTPKIYSETDQNMGRQRKRR